MNAEPARPAPVAVAIVSFNERALLAACLRSLEADARTGRAEVWVVDNASWDGSADLVRADFPWASLIACERNHGYGAAVNLVAARTDCAFVAPANQDVELEEGSLARLIAAADAHPRAGVVAPRLVGAHGATQHSVHPFPTVWLTVAYNLGLHRLSARLADRLCIEGWWRPERSRAVDWALGAFLLVRREAFDAAGGFDDDMWMYAEDLDLAWRLRRAGWGTWYESSAVVRHQGAVSARKAFGGEVESRFMAASYAWMVRRRGRGVASTVAAVNALGSGLGALALSLAAALRPGRFGPSRDHYARWARIHAAGLRARRR